MAFRFWIDQEKKLAVIELSEALGAALSESETRSNSWTTFGVGEMILDATTRAKGKSLRSGWQRDKRWRFGMARALGFHFFGEEKRDSIVCRASLLKRIERPKD